MATAKNSPQGQMQADQPAQQQAGSSPVRAETPAPQQQGQSTGTRQITDFASI